MNVRPKLRMPLLAAALAASVASAWATYELGQSTYVPAPVTASPANAAATTAPLVAEPMVTADETVIATDAPAAPAREPGDAARPQPAAVPVAEATRPEPALEITKPRLTVDQRIQADVMDVLARNPNLSGKIGVVSEDSVVTLTGYTATSGQAWRAGRDARGVQGVRHVVNEIRPRVGGITS